MQSGAIRSNLEQSDAIWSHPMQSGAIRCKQEPSDAIRSHPMQSGAIRSNQAAIRHLQPIVLGPEAFSARQSPCLCLCSLAARW